MTVLQSETAEPEAKDQAFALIVDSFNGYVHHCVRPVLSPNAMHHADDVVQETFLNVYVNSSSYMPGRGLLPWLGTIARNKAIDVLRREARHDFVDTTDISDLLSEQATDEPWQYVELVDTLSTLNSIGIRGASVAIMLSAAGFTTREIAESQGVAQGTIKSRMHHGRQAARQVLSVVE